MTQITKRPSSLAESIAMKEAVMKREIRAHALDEVAKEVERLIKALEAGMSEKTPTTRLPTQEQIELPPKCTMVQEHEGGRVRVYYGRKQVLVGEGLTEEDAIISAYKGLVKNFLRPDMEEL